MYAGQVACCDQRGAGRHPADQGVVAVGDQAAQQRRGAASVVVVDGQSGGRGICAELAPGTAVAVCVDHHHRSGTTSLLGSLVSNSHDALVGAVTTCAALVAAGDLAGIHLEGPFLSMERRGAQNPAALCDVDAGLLEALAATATTAGAPAALAQMTFAPERPGATGLPALLGSHGVLAAVGHTDCDAETAWAALRAGLDAAPRGGRPLVTHVA